jgi:hypothetical protein
MDIDSDGELLAAVRAFIGSRASGEVLNTLYHNTVPVADDALNALTALLPIEQIAVVQLVDRLNLSGLPAVVILLAVLRKIRTDDAWIHYNLAKHLSSLLQAGVPEAKLPAVIHSLFACEGLKDSPNAQPLPPAGVDRRIGSIRPT